MIQVLIVDDHRMMCEAIKGLLSEMSDIEVIAFVESGEEAVKIAKQKRPHVVLMDVKMPGIGGIEALRRIVRFDPNIKVIMVTALEQEPFPTALLQAGASGFLKKASSVNEMRLAIRSVYAGQRYLNPEMAQALALQMFAEDTPSSNPFAALSIRELQVMLMLTDGQTPKSIGQKLCVSSKTVNNYKHQLYEKLRVQNLVQLTLLAEKYGFLEILTDKIASGPERTEDPLELKTTVPDPEAL